VPAGPAAVQLCSEWSLLRKKGWNCGAARLDLDHLKIFLAGTTQDRSNSLVHRSGVPARSVFGIPGGLVIYPSIYEAHPGSRFTHGALWFALYNGKISSPHLEEPVRVSTHATYLTFLPTSGSLSVTGLFDAREGQR
jgi:hypothetical protein